MNVINRVTLAGLRKNRTRTIVTIIGVILSAAMITAVTTLIASLQSYMVDYTIASEGNWHAALQNGSADDLAALREMEGVEGVAVAQGGGYALLPGSKNEYKPYLYLLQYDQAAFATLPVSLISGRLPESADEVLITSHIATEGGVNYRLGETLTLELGQRLAPDGRAMNQYDSYLSGEDNTDPERFVPQETRTFTIVGLASRPAWSIEGFSSPGFTLYSPLAEEALSDGQITIYFRASNPRRIYQLTSRIERELVLNEYSSIETNSELLRFMGISGNRNFLTALYGLGAILLGLIVVGSVSLINNSFSISTSEREKHFGLLASVGATARQLKRSVFFEALIIGGIGVPLGIGAGVAGIAVTLHSLEDEFAGILGGSVAGRDLAFQLVVPLSALLIAALLALVTILISAYIPARRVGEISAMDAIRLTTETRLSARQVRTSRLTRKLFGFPGELALKNLKRSRRRYRSTVFSLFISVVLFISATAFSGYLRNGVSNVYENTNYDLSYYMVNAALAQIPVEPLRAQLIALPSVSSGSIVSPYYGSVKLQPEQVDPDYYEGSGGAETGGEEGALTVSLRIHAVDSATFSDYAAGFGLDAAELRKPERPAAIVIDQQHFYSPAEGRYRNTSIFARPAPTSLELTLWDGGEAPTAVQMQVAALADTAPQGVQPYAQHGEIFLVIDAQLATALWGEPNFTSIYLTADRPAQAEEEIREVLQTQGLPISNLYNMAEAGQTDRSLITIISVFSYGFIVLMSLITIANVFNTISTNVNLRRREFAMLKSVGMTERDFNRMLDYECIFYGLRALFLGLPVSVGVTLLIYRSVNAGVDMAFRLPLDGMLIATISVFLVVFISMKYSRNRVRRENILDALKNENL